jgi:hypothetical protein
MDQRGTKVQNDEVKREAREIFAEFVDFETSDCLVAMINEIGRLGNQNAPQKRLLIRGQNLLSQVSQVEPLSELSQDDRDLAHTHFAP